MFKVYCERHFEAPYCIADMSRVPDAPETMREMRDMMARMSAEMSSLRAEVGRLVGEVDKIKQQPPLEPPAPPKPPEYAKGHWVHYASLGPSRNTFVLDDPDDPRPPPPGPDDDPDHWGYNGAAAYPYYRNLPAAREDEWADEWPAQHRGLPAPPEDEYPAQYRGLGAM